MEQLPSGVNPPPVINLRVRGYCPSCGDVVEVVPDPPARRVSPGGLSPLDVCLFLLAGYLAGHILGTILFPAERDA